jgi:hypothetical protein
VQTGVLCTLGYVRVRGGERVGGSGDYAEFDSPKPAVLAVDGVVLRFRRRVLGRSAGLSRPAGTIGEQTGDFRPLL